jgi:oxygen-independent coproporphyrinogen-3 oxidase
VTTDDLSFEFMLNNLRLSAGFNLAEFTRLTGLGGEVVLPSLMAAQKRGLLQDLGEGGWRPTPRGWQFLNDLQALFLP